MKTMFLPVLVVVIAFFYTTGARANEPEHETSFGAVAESVSEATGLGISPFFVMGAMGTYKYWMASDFERPNLEWYCHPAVWGSIWALLLLCALKVTISSVVPGATKPLDAVERATKQVAGPVAGMSVAGTSVLKASAIFASTHQGAPRMLCASALMGGESLPAWFLLLTACFFGFGVVWLAFNAIDTLIFLCPFGAVEFVSKILKVGLVLLILGAAMLSPFLALLICAILILIATKIAGWAFRITVFGMVITTDYLFPWIARKKVDATNPHAFVACHQLRVPSRTYGRLTYADGEITFTYRPYLIFPQKRVKLPAVSRCVVRGVLMPSVSDTIPEKGSAKIMFPPRYRGKEELLSRGLMINEIRDCAIIRGWKAFKNWLAESFGMKTIPVPAS
ncbi:MAG: hypothetical protein IAE94_09510 [Chthoniobacterales bacterium]|nr:hypothetical protein [Chthoniobacterales bacterium]